jgi:hypothetical protein
MNKVYFNRLARSDLRAIFIGLLTWKKIEISREEAKSYVLSIYQVALTIPKKHFHERCKYKMHLKYGTYAVRYRRNSRTMWYVIYNIDPFTGNIFVEKIVNNYTTKI